MATEMAEKESYYWNAPQISELPRRILEIDYLASGIRICEDNGHSMRSDGERRHVAVLCVADVRSKVALQELARRKEQLIAAARAFVMDELCDLGWSPSNAKEVASLEVACAQADADWRIADAMAKVMADEAEQTPTLFNAQRFQHSRVKQMDERDRFDHLQRLREWTRKIVRGEESDDLTTAMLAEVR